MAVDPLECNDRFAKHNPTQRHPVRGVQTRIETTVYRGACLLESMQYYYIAKPERPSLTGHGQMYEGLPTDWLL